MFKKVEFIVKILAFAITFYFTIDYIFACEVNNVFGITILLMILISITIFHYYFNKNKNKICD